MKAPAAERWPGFSCVMLMRLRCCSRFGWHVLFRRGRRRRLGRGRGERRGCRHVVGFSAHVRFCDCVLRLRLDRRIVSGVCLPRVQFQRRIHRILYKNHRRAPLPRQVDPQCLWSKQLFLHGGKMLETAETKFDKVDPDSVSSSSYVVRSSVNPDSPRAMGGYSDRFSKPEGAVLMVPPKSPAGSPRGSRSDVTRDYRHTPACPRLVPVLVSSAGGWAGARGRRSVSRAMPAAAGARRAPGPLPSSWPTRPFAEAPKRPLPPLS